MEDGLDTAGGYGELGNLSKIVEMKELSYEKQKAYAKKLWQEDPIKYKGWKEFCIWYNRLPEFFGTYDNPKEIDESKL